MAIKEYFIKEKPTKEFLPKDGAGTSIVFTDNYMEIKADFPYMIEEEDENGNKDFDKKKLFVTYRLRRDKVAITELIYNKDEDKYIWTLNESEVLTIDEDAIEMMKGVDDFLHEWAK